MFAVLATVALVLRGIMLLVAYITTDSFPQPLSRQEEKYYLQMLERGNEFARQVLIEHNLRLVAHVVRN